jgi:hypothetical protein
MAGDKMPLFNSRNDRFGKKKVHKSKKMSRGRYINDVVEMPGMFTSDFDEKYLSILLNLTNLGEIDDITRDQKRPKSKHASKSTLNSFNF